MELQEVGKYSVEPFALERILELEVVKKVKIGRASCRERV